MAIITLTSDFGLKDGNAALLKGMIWRIAPTVQITDISHLIQPQNIFEASLILFYTALYFPEETIHIIIVDPRGKLSNRPIAVKIKSHYFICHDNGVLTLLLNYAKESNWPVESFHLTNSQYWLPNSSFPLYGLEIFASVAAHLANGKNLQNLGLPINDIASIDVSSPQCFADKIIGEILYVDSFGNIITNILDNHINNYSHITIKLCGFEIFNVIHSFHERSSGEIVALLSNIHYLSIAMINGNAADKLCAKIGQSVEICIQ
jgi:S-adenosyl-L-methionine hydrolase (adenosine-forming)